MPERLFLFLQMEFPWDLGPPEGRYLLRSGPEAEPERVVVLGVLGAPRRGGAPRGRRAGGRLLGRRGAVASPEPELLATTRATIVDPVALSAERQAEAWLSELDADRETHAAAAALNRIIHFHRIASADPYVHEVTAEHALVIRVGWGEGEQVAYGRWRHAREIAPPASHSGPSRGRRRARERTASLRGQERLAELLGARSSALLCEELVLRAREDLDQGRPAHCAIELAAAYGSGIRELSGEQRADLEIRIAELQKLSAGVSVQAQAALGGELSDDGVEIVRHGLERLEAALRARSAYGSRGS